MHNVRGIVSHPPADHLSLKIDVFDDIIKCKLIIYIYISLNSIYMYVYVYYSHTASFHTRNGRRKMRRTYIEIYAYIDA